MSILIGKLIEEICGIRIGSRGIINKTQIDDSLYVAKPLPRMCFWFITWLTNLKDACRVLRGKSIAVHYKVDEE